jgi:flagellar FliL protein
MAKEEKEEVAAEEPVKKKKPIVKIIIIAVSVLVVVAGGVLGAMYYFGKAGTAHKAAAPPPPAIGVLWPMEPFIVNLLDNQGERYLKVVMQLEVSSQLVVAELELLKPKLRDNVLDLLAAKTYGELMDMGGKQRLRDEVAVRVNSFLTKGKVVKVYFTDFVIQ